MASRTPAELRLYEQARPSPQQPLPPRRASPCGSVGAPLTPAAAFAARSVPASDRPEPQH